MQDEEHTQNLTEGKLYAYKDGKLEEVKPSDTKRISISDEAHEGLKNFRAEAKKTLRFRPELHDVASLIVMVGLSQDKETLNDALRNHFLNLLNTTES